MTSIFKTDAHGNYKINKVVFINFTKRFEYSYLLFLA